MRSIIRGFSTVIEWAVGLVMYAKFLADLAYEADVRAGLAPIDPNRILTTRRGLNDRTLWKD